MKGRAGDAAVDIAFVGDDGGREILAGGGFGVGVGEGGGENEAMPRCEVEICAKDVGFVFAGEDYASGSEDLFGEGRQAGDDEFGNDVGVGGGFVARGVELVSERRLQPA